jgi:hypothetical protein
MWRLKLLLVTYLMLTPALAHVCDDVYRVGMDVVRIEPEEEVIRIVEGSAEFKVFFKSYYSYPLHNIQLIPVSNKFIIEVNPPLIEEIKPGGIGFWVVRLEVPQEVDPGSYTLEMEVDAREFKIRRKVSFLVQTGEVARVEMIREERTTHFYLLIILIFVIALALGKIRIHLRSKQRQVR